MASVMTLHRSLIGQKALVAVTGLVLFGFVIGHLAGNLLVFAGHEALNNYAFGLKNMPPLLWGTRIVLLGSVLVHIGLTMSLARRNAGARKGGYAKSQSVLHQYAARTMVISGPLLAAYIIFHIAHFTAPGLDLGGDWDHLDVYGNVVRGFRVPYVAGIYIFANLLLGLHLFHGAWSALQSLGAGHPKYNPMRKTIATALALGICIGNVSIPTAILVGVVGTDEQLEASRLDPLGDADESATGEQE